MDCFISFGTTAPRYQLMRNIFPKHVLAVKRGGELLIRVLKLIRAGGGMQINDITRKNRNFGELLLGRYSDKSNDK